MISESEARDRVAERFAADLNAQLWPFSLGWVITFDVPSRRELTAEGLPANPGGTNYVLDARTGEFVPCGSLSPGMIARIYERNNATS